MKFVDTSPPNTSIFFPHHTGLLDVSELERRGSPHGGATVLINRNHSANSRSIFGINGTTAPAVPLTVQDVTWIRTSFPEPSARPKNDTLHTSSSRRLIEHKLNELRGSIQHSLALKALASPPAFSFNGACRSLRFKCRLLLWPLASLLFDDRALSNCSLC